MAYILIEAGKRVLLTAMLFFSVTEARAHRQDSPLKIEIKTSRAVVHNNQVFVVDTMIRNTTEEEQVLQTTQCTYGDWNWITDNPAVRVQDGKREMLSLIHI